MASDDLLLRVARAVLGGVIERERVLGGEARAAAMREDYDDARLGEYVAPFEAERRAGRVQCQARNGNDRCTLDAGHDQHVGEGVRWTVATPAPVFATPAAPQATAERDKPCE